MTFTGLHAFPLTPLRDDRVDDVAFGGLVERAAAAGVDAITALGGTGAYLYLSDDERRRAARVAIAAAGPVPVIVGAGALRTSQVLALAHDAADAGAAGLLIGPVGYHALTDDDVLAFYETLSAELELPFMIYDDPGGTQFVFGDELLGHVARLPGAAAIKTPGIPRDASGARERIGQLRGALPERVTIGASGDAGAAVALLAGADAWCSVLAGTLPEPAVAISRAARSGDAAAAIAESARLQPLWELMAAHGGIRVVGAIAELLGLAADGCLPLPVRGLGGVARERVAAVLRELELT